MLLIFNKMSFGQVLRLITLTKTYLEDGGFGDSKKRKVSQLIWQDTHERHELEEKKIAYTDSEAEIENR